MNWRRNSNRWESLVAGAVGLAFPNSVAYVARTFALWRVNAVVVPIPTECTEDEIAELAAAIQLEAMLSPAIARRKRGAGSGLLFCPSESAVTVGQSWVESRFHPFHFRHDQRAQGSSPRARDHSRPGAVREPGVRHRARRHGDLVSADGASFSHHHRLVFERGRDGGSGAACCGASRFSRQSIAGREQSSMPRRFTSPCWPAITRERRYPPSASRCPRRVRCRRMSADDFFKRFGLALAQALGRDRTRPRCSEHRRPARTLEFGGQTRRRFSGAHQ